MIIFTSSRQDTLRIEGNKITVTNKFNDTYTGYINENGYVVTKSRLGLREPDVEWFRLEEVQKD